MGKFVLFFQVLYNYLFKMPRKCVIINCRSGYLPKKNEHPQDVMNPVFGFPDKTNDIRTNGCPGYDSLTERIGHPESLMVFTRSIFSHNI